MIFIFCSVCSYYNLTRSNLDFPQILGDCSSCKYKRRFFDFLSSFSYTLHLIIEDKKNNDVKDEENII